MEDSRQYQEMKVAVIQNKAFTETLIVLSMAAWPQNAVPHGKFFMYKKV